MNGALITAGSKPSRRASSGSSDPTSVASVHTVNSVSDTTSARRLSSTKKDVGRNAMVAEHRSEQQAHARLAQHDQRHVAGAQLAHGQRARHGRRRLRAGVAAGADHEWDEQRQRHDRGERLPRRR